MDALLTLIDADRSPDFVRLADRLARSLGVEPCWLSPGHAVQFDAGDRTGQALAMIGDAGLARLDHALTPKQGGVKRLLLSDMDSTIIENECIDELALRAGIGDQVASITGRAMRGDLDFEQALRARVRLLEGLEIALIDEIIRDQIRIKPGAKILVATMRGHGAYTALVSGGFNEFTGHIRRATGFDMDQANRLRVRDGLLTGGLYDPVLGPDAKREVLGRLCVRCGITPGQVLAVGDGANDIPMIEAAGLGVAFHAHPKVRASADVCIDHNDLTALLYIQGLSDAQFIRP